MHLNTHLIRRDWVSACHFHDLPEQEVLNSVLRSVGERRAGKSQRPVVLLDLDSTLYEVGPRTHRILKEWVDSKESAVHRSVREHLAGLRLEHVGYSLRDTFAASGLNPESAEVKEVLPAVQKYWRDRFFTSAYLPYDRVYDGAAEYAREVHKAGAEVVYLTGREEAPMGEGTRARLLQDGFPWEVERTHLLLRQPSVTTDLEHKQKACEYVRSTGPLVASFENEPPNLVAIQEIFPESMHVFVETVCSDHPAPVAKGLYRIQGFESFGA